MSAAKAILFDLGNTLLYFDGVWPQVFSQADQGLLTYLQSTGMALEGESFLGEFRGRLNAYYQQRESEFIEHTTAYVLRTLLAELGYSDIPEETISQAMNSMYAISQAHWKLEPDAIECLQTLRSRGCRIGIISNAGNDADVQTLVDKTQIRPYFDFVLSSAACGIRKPNPRIFHLALEKWGITPGEAVMVGDTLGADILGARNAGIFSVWITRRADTPANRDHADTIQPDASIAKLSELPDLLDANSL
ncbi:MAG: HAD family hydrolase [Anaerolineae bacterium]|nr:HAD family hydrolase [Anaerolineae bacterium]